jgi:MFS-type transporter involved in bile tolerance (Atg22 family)
VGPVSLDWGNSACSRAATMIEYAILIVMVIFTIGFAWLWFIEQKKKRKRKEAQQTKIER